MGILDELKEQAEKQQAGPAEEAQPPVAEEYYRGHVQARMLSAFKFLSELVNQLNSMNLDTRVDYPFKPDGKPVRLLQQGYKVYNDHITEPRQITLTFTCTLVNPTSYEVNERAAVLKQSDLLDRFQFKYEKLEQKDPRQIVIGARFKLIGPLSIKTVLQFDDSKQIIKLIMTNFAGPGTSQYNIKPENLDEAFLDDLAKYILRKKDSLFREELSDEVKARLRKKLQEEQQSREAELQVMEETRRAEATLRKHNSAKEQIKKVVGVQKEQLKKAMGEQLEQKKEKLRDMLGKIKKQANAVLTSAPKQASPETQPATMPAGQSEKQSDVAPASTQAMQQPVAAKRVPPSATIQQTTHTPTSPAQASPQASIESAIPANTNKAGQAYPVPSAQPKMPADDVTADGQATPASVAPQKKSQPPKIYNAPPGNPFIKPEPPVEVLLAEERQQQQGNLQDQHETVATALADTSARPDVAPEAREEYLARSIERDQAGNVQQKAEKASAPSAPELPASAMQETKSEAGAATANPFLQSSVAKVDAPDGVRHPEPFPKTGELDTPILNHAPLAQQMRRADDAQVPEEREHTRNSTSKSETLDIDLSENVVSPDDKDAKDNS